MVQNLQSFARIAFLLFASIALLGLLSAVPATAQTAAITTDTVSSASEVVVAFTMTALPSNGFIESATFSTQGMSALCFSVVNAATPALASNGAPMTTNDVKLWLYGAASIREVTDSYIPIALIGNYGASQVDVSRFNALRVKITATSDDDTIRLYGKWK